MMKKFLLFLIALLGMGSAWAYDFSAVAPSGQTLYYNIVDSTSVMVRYPNDQWGDLWGGYTKPTGNLVIPDSVTHNGTTYAVTQIRGYAFYQCTGLTSVTIPNTVTIISSEDDYAFGYCSGLTSVTIPNSVTTIGRRAFYNCSGLTGVTIPNSVTSIGDGAFGQVRLVSYCGSATGSPWGATRVGCFYEDGEFIFEDATQTTILAYIGTGSSVTIPNSVTTIGNYAFYGCSGLTSVAFNATHCIVNSPVFEGCGNLTSVTFGENVTVIPAHIFQNCSGLTSVTIPNSVDTIGVSAFEGCSGIRTLDLGDSLLVIQDSAFKDCNALVNITIPESLTYLGRDAFFVEDGHFIVQYNAIDCEEGYYDRDNNFVYSPFGNSLRTITFGDHVSWIPAGLCAFNSNLTQVNFSNSTHLNINTVAFYGCTGLTSIVLPYSVDTIAYSVFYGCTNITSLTLGEDLKWVGDNSFSGMTSLSTIICRGTEPAELNNINVFEGTPTNNIEVIVPCNTADTYRAAYGWNTLQNYSEQLFHTLTVRSADNTKGSVSILVQPDCENLQAQFQASAYNGFHFDHWSDGNTDNPRYLVLTQDTVLEAIFLADGEEGISDLASAGITVSTNGRTIALAGTNGQMLSIYDVTGRVIVREKAVEGKAYTMPNAGVYMVQVGSHKAEKVVVR